MQCLHPCTIIFGYAPNWNDVRTNGKSSGLSNSSIINDLDLKVTSHFLLAEVYVTKSTQKKKENLKVVVVPLL